MSSWLTISPNTPTQILSQDWGQIPATSTCKIITKLSPLPFPITLTGTSFNTPSGSHVPALFEKIPWNLSKHCCGLQEIKLCKSHLTMQWPPHHLKPCHVWMSHLPSLPWWPCCLEVYSLSAHFQGKHHIKLNAHFPLNISLAQSEKNRMWKIWNSHYQLPKTHKLKSKKNPTLPISEVHWWLLSTMSAISFSNLNTFYLGLQELCWLWYRWHNCPFLSTVNCINCKQQWQHGKGQDAWWAGKWRP